ncbi:hypothetical protein [Streptomyces sp. H51]|uniref:hypothetical protein n=1 Tax=Streptomyces sp. H51 TaxID=3111770 RepID=UPI002D79A430|nr:hypothetical protein [Streptomyces sp. H51]
MSLEQLRGQFYWLTSVVLRTDLHPSEAVIELNSESAGATLRLEGIVHARACLAGPDCDFVDEITVRELPQHGPWPAEAHHLVHHHDNRRALQWLTIIGPSEVEILAERFSED